MHSVDVARTHEILARYRPIAPRPPMLETPASSAETPAAVAAPAVQIPARTPRSRKRGRGSCSAVSQKRCRTYVPVLPSPLAGSCHQAALAVQGFARGYPAIPFLGGATSGRIEKLAGDTSRSDGNSGGDILALSLLPPSPPTKGKMLDLNSDPTAAATAPTEKDLLGTLQKPTLIMPQPVRPVGSSISIVGTIDENTAHAFQTAPVVKKTPEEVEEEVESEVLPAVISDSNNRVRLANSTYKEMVGQPKCPWLESMATTKERAPGRISGEVVLDLQEFHVPISSNGFSCKVKIEWACNGQKTCLTVPCDVIRLSCESKDYLFTWKFHSTEGSVSNCKA